jgi:hypothetical protein
MQRRDVASSMIRSIGHDADISVLEIEFLNGTIWQYFDFSENSWHEFIAADSHGKYFRANIKGSFRDGQVG